MGETLSAVLILIGTTFMLLASIGITRMPDLLTRMQPTSKAATLGISCVMLAVAFHFGDLGITTRALAVVAFFFLTAPVAAHIIARAAYFVGVPLWEGTVCDELRGQYDPTTHSLGSPNTFLQTADLHQLSAKDEHRHST